MNNLCCVLDPFTKCNNCDWKSCFKCFYSNDMKDLLISHHPDVCKNIELTVMIEYVKDD